MVADKRIRAAIVLLSILFSAIVPVNGQSATELLRREIAQLIEFETAIDTEATPGFIVGIIDGQNEAILSFGRRNKTSTDTIRQDDIFELGSVTKLVTAAVCVELAQAGKVDLQTDIANYLPEEFRNVNDYEVTLEMLLSHHSGLPREPSSANELGDPLQTRYNIPAETILNEYRELAQPSEESMLYSHVGYALIEPILYYTTGSTYPELVRTHIQEQIGLRHTSMSSQLTIEGYGLDGKPEAPCDYGYFAASGGLHSSIEDLISFARYALDDAPATIFEKHGIGLNKYLGIGLGWHIVYPKGKVEVHMHTGRSPGHSAFIGLVRQTGTAVVILCNSAAGTDDLGMEILRIMNRNWKRK